MTWTVTFALAAAPADPPPAQAPPALPSSFLSDGMVKSVIKRGAYELADKLEMDDAQRAEFTRALMDRWMPFVERHRDDLGPLIDRMMQAVWDPELPPVDQAQAWAKDALKMHDLFVEELDKSNQDVAKILTPQQLGRYQREAAKFSAGLGLFRLELAKMADGQLQDTMWAKRRMSRQERRKRHQQAQAQQAPPPAPAASALTTVSVDLWERYVTEFIAQFGLDETQKATARTVLNDVKQRGLQYTRTRRDELGSLQRKLQTAKQAERQDLLKQQAELVKPLTDLFSELQSRLAEIPTEAQRQQATAAGRPDPAE